MNASVLIATPAYAQTILVPYHLSILQLLDDKRDCHIDMSFVSDSLISRARNTLVAQFLANPQLTHLFFIDSDIGFSPDQFHRLVDSDLDVVAGICPYKTIRRSPNPYSAQMPDDLWKASNCRYVVNFVNDVIPSTGTFIEVQDARTGFMCIKRSVIETMIASDPTLKSTPLDPTETPGCHYRCFNTMEDGETDLAEDYAFCRRWQKCGGKIYVDYNSQFSHTGTYTFPGNFQLSLEAAKWKPTC